MKFQLKILFKMKIKNLKLIIMTIWLILEVIKELHTLL